MSRVSSGVSASSPSWTQYALPLALMSALILFSSSSKSSSIKSTGIFAIVVMIGLLAVTQSDSMADTPYVAIRIRVPSGVALGAVSLNLVDGSVTSTTSEISVSSLSVSLCGTAATSSATVTVDDMIVTSGDVTVCSKGAAKLTNLAVTGKTTVESTASTAYVSLLDSKFIGGRATLKSTSGSVSVTGTSVCTFSTDTTSSKSGSCGSGSQDIKVNAKSNLIFKFVESVSTCKSSYVDPPATTTPVSSPAVDNNKRTLIFPAATTDLFIGVSSYKTGTAYNISIAPTSEGTLVLPYASYYSQESRLYNTRLYAFGKGSTSKLTFKPKVNGISSGVSVTSMTLLTLSDPPKTSKEVFDLGNSFDSYSSSLITNRLVLKSGSGLPSVWDGSATATFTLPTTTADFGGYFMLVTNISASSKTAWNLEIASFQFSTSFSVPSSGNFDGTTSEAVTVYKMPKALDANPRTAAACPHLKSNLKNWHDPSTWPSGSVPSPDTTITLPASTSVLVSSCSFSSDVYSKIIIPEGSQLIFADADISLRVRNIYVQGDLLIGSPTCRLNSYIDIEFVGAKSTSDSIATSLGSKGIGVSGSIDIHGFQYHPTWTRLSSSIVTGADVIQVQDANNWEVGQEIVVSTSYWKDLTEGDYNEVRTIKAIDKSGKRIQVTEPFNFFHYAGYEHQVEVGLLTRRISLRGDDQSEKESFGGHIRVIGEGRFSGVSATRMGQKNMIGKYPFHFHAMGPAPTSFVKDCSIVNSYYRCVAIHQTNNTQTLRNVAFNATGHCFYVEDGVEENNEISYNLAVRVNVIGEVMGGEAQTGDTTNENADFPLPADSAAAGFYITNAYNTIIGNAASGGWAGFSFPNLPTPIKLSRSWGVFPEKRPTLKFLGNTAHSSGYAFPGGGCIYTGGLLWYPTGSDLLRYNNGRYARDTLNADNSAEGIMFFNHSKTWLCGLGVSHWGKRIEIVDYESHDVGRAVQLFGEAWFSRALVNAKSASLISYKDYTSKDGSQGFQFYDVNVKSIVTDVTFRGFKANSPTPWDFNSTTSPATWGDARIFTSLIHSDAFKPQGISATKNLVFENSDRSQFFGHKLIETGASRYTNFVDWDGTFGGTAGTPQIIGDSRGWWNWNAKCVFEPDWVLHRCPQGDRTVVFVDMFIPGVIVDDGEDLTDMAPSSLYLGQTHLFGPGVPTTSSHNVTFTRDPGVTGVSKLGWYWNLNEGSPTEFSIWPGLFPTGHWIVAAFSYPTSTTFTITLSQNKGKYVNTLTNASSFAKMMASNDGTLYYFDKSTGHLYIKIYNPWTDSGNGYTRDGVTLWDISRKVWFTVKASCGSSSTYCATSSYKLPTVTW